MSTHPDTLQTVILAGGLGSRMNGYAGDCPKALIPVAGRPLIEHVMATYDRCGHRDFIIATGHRYEKVHEYFESHDGQPCKAATPGEKRRNVRCIYSGANTQTGGRLKRLQPYLDGQTFMLTWTDGIADLDINALVEFHRRHGKIATLSTVRPPPRFGHLTFDTNGLVLNFEEKPEGREGWINGAFFVLERQIFDYIKDDRSEFERDVLVKLAEDQELMAFQHHGRWRCADTEADIRRLEEFARQTDLPIG